MDKFSNWADNKAVEEAIVHLLGKGVAQLGLQVRGILPASEKEKDGEAEDGAASIATSESGWEAIEKGGSVMLEVPPAVAGGGEEKPEGEKTSGE